MSQRNAASSTALPRPFGPYELLRKLAAGGMAEVYLARARSVAGFEKVVALKTLFPNAAEEAEFTRSLVDEANIIAQLSHRNIVQIIELGQHDGRHFMAMEFVEGVDLARLLSRLKERGQRLSTRVAAFIVHEVCNALDHAHRKVGQDGQPLGVIHRDVSPPNILVSVAGEVKLTDFGIAKATQRLNATKAGQVKGKYAYMAPEQVRGGEYDQRVDLFAAGAVLYELCTMRPLYPDTAVTLLLDKVANARFEAPEKLRPDFPGELLGILRRALAKKPAERFATARAMADALSKWLYTQAPAPEVELGDLVSDLMDQGTPSVPPLASVQLGDEDDGLDQATVIESMAVVRQKMAQPTVPPPSGEEAIDGQDATRALRRGAPSGSHPTVEVDPEPTRTVRAGASRASVASSQELKIPPAPKVPEVRAPAVPLPELASSESSKAQTAAPVGRPPRDPADGFDVQPTTVRNRPSLPSPPGAPEPPPSNPAWPAPHSVSVAPPAPAPGPPVAVAAPPMPAAHTAPAPMPAPTAAPQEQLPLGAIVLAGSFAVLGVGLLLWVVAATR